MKFFVTEIDSDNNSKVDKEGIVISYIREFTLDEALSLVRQAEITSRETYGFKVIKDNESVFFRFYNITTRINDTAEEFIKKNWRS